MAPGADATTGRRLFEVAQRGADRSALESLTSAQREALAALLVDVDRALERGHTLVDERDLPDGDSERAVPNDVANGDAAHAGDGALHPAPHEATHQAPHEATHPAPHEATRDAVAWRAGFDAADALARAASTAAASDPPGTLRLVARVSAGRDDAPIPAAYALRGAPGSRRISTARSADDERRIARSMLERAGAAPASAEEAVAARKAGASSGRIARAADSSGMGGDEQAIAVERAARSRLLLLTGGPGTGKTHTIARLVMSRLTATVGGTSPRITIMAPTGRAAARLREQLAAALPSAGAAEPHGGAASTTVSTIHAALRWQPIPGAPFAHTRENPMPTDLVIVDECSMVDLSLMRRLIEATPSDAGLVLVGDADQLASVEAGSVFADLCAAPAMAASLVRLTRNFRTAGDPRAAWLASLVDSVRVGDVERVIAALRSAGALIEPGGGGTSGAGSLTRLAVETALSEYERILDAWRDRAHEDPLAAFDALRRFRVLAATRRGDGGVEPITAQIDARLRRGPGDVGRHVMILENDRDADLANGDMGVVVRGGVVVGRRSDGSPRVLPEASLPAHEPAWAISIHKSQGSEFERIVVVLPDAASPILSRQLLYTALTRSRGDVRVVARESSVRRAVAQSVRRAGGLGDAIESIAGSSAMITTRDG